MAKSTTQRKKAPPAKPEGKPRPVDAHVGARLKLRRTLVGMSQEKLGDAVGLTFQQIQKYERGANRIGSSRLFEFSQILDVPVSYFFDDMPEDVVKGGVSDVSGGIDLDEAAEGDPLTRRETLELVRSYYRIADPHVRKRIYELVKSVSQVEDEG
jgi:transcriptional regulator with XRE-family HTH domain